MRWDWQAAYRTWLTLGGGREREGEREGCWILYFYFGPVCSYQRHGIPERQDNAVFVTVTR